MRPTGRVRHIRFAACAAFLCALFAVTASNVVSAEDTWGFGPKPLGDGPSRDFLIYDLATGSSLSDEVRLSNFTDRPLTFRIYARDAFSADDGVGFAVQTFDQPPVDAGGWFQLPDGVDPYVLPAQTSADIPFSLTIPANASPGDHPAAVVAELIADDSGEGTGVEVRQRIATRVYIRVPGDLRPAMAVSSISIEYDNPVINVGSRAVVTYSVSNVGNVRLSPQIALVLKDLFGRTVRRADLRDFADVLPNGTVQVTEVFEDVFPGGRLTAEVTAYTQGAVPTSAGASTSVWAIPWMLVILVLILLALFTWLLLRRRRRRVPG